MKQMNKENELNLMSIIEQAIDRIDRKYRKGDEQHGGKLWKKKGIIEMAIDEAIDQVVYLITLKQQIDSKTLYTVRGKDKD
jgi:hypothetical protein